jgi:hypothetical protein
MKRASWREGRFRLFERGTRLSPCPPCSYRRADSRRWYNANVGRVLVSPCHSSFASPSRSEVPSEVPPARLARLLGGCSSEEVLVRHGRFGATAAVKVPGAAAAGGGGRRRGERGPSSTKGTPLPLPLLPLVPFLSSRAVAVARDRQRQRIEVHHPQCARDQHGRRGCWRRGIMLGSGGRRWRRRQQRGEREVSSAKGSSTLSQLTLLLLRPGTARGRAPGQSVERHHP